MIALVSSGGLHGIADRCLASGEPAAARRQWRSSTSAHVRLMDVQRVTWDNPRISARCRLAEVSADAVKLDWRLAKAGLLREIKRG